MAGGPRKGSERPGWSEDQGLQFSVCVYNASTMELKLDDIVAVLMICGTLAGIGWKLGSIGLGILDRMGNLEKKVEVLITKIGTNDERMNRQDSRIDRIETRLEKVEQGEIG